MHKKLPDGRKVTDPYGSYASRPYGEYLERFYVFYSLCESIWRDRLKGWSVVERFSTQRDKTGALGVDLKPLDPMKPWRTSKLDDL